MAIFTGFSSNGVPYTHLSDSGPALVVFTGSELEHVPPSKMAQQGFYIGLKRLTRQYSIYLMSPVQRLHRPGYEQRLCRDDSQGHWQACPHHGHVQRRLQRHASCGRPCGSGG